MTVYHIKDNYEPGICKAKPGGCPLTAVDEHFNNIEDAYEYSEKLLTEENNLLNDYRNDFLNSINDEIIQEMGMKSCFGDYVETINDLRNPEFSLNNCETVSYYVQQYSNSEQITLDLTTSDFFRKHCANKFFIDDKEYVVDFTYSQIDPYQDFPYVAL